MFKPIEYAWRKNVKAYWSFNVFFKSKKYRVLKEKMY